MQTPTTLYLDHAATAPVWPQVRAAMAPYLDDRFANASSLYAGAREARKAIEEAREIIASAVGARPDDVIFTSGGTEADNLALQGVAWRAKPQGRDTIVVSAIEHHAVLDTAEWLGAHGWRTRIIPVSSEGVVDLDAVDAAIDRTTAIVSVMTANNEVGALQPVAAVAEIARARGAVFHTDAVQALPWIDVRGANADLIALSAHKAGGPKGVGALIRRRGVGLEPVTHGGGQERGLRSGTYNVAGIVGFGEAVRVTMERRGEVARVRALRDRLQETLRARVADVRVSAAGAERLPGALHLCIPGVGSEPLLLLLDGAGVAASSGSACQSGAVEPSHVLRAMGVPDALARGALRVTLGYETTQADVDTAAAAIVDAVGRLRR